MQIDYDQILAKRPHSEDAVFAWHQDMAYWPPFTSDISAATCWLAVSDSTEENGCMRFVAGSQKEPELRKHAPGVGLGVVVTCMLNKKLKCDATLSCVTTMQIKHCTASATHVCMVCQLLLAYTYWEYLWCCPYGTKIAGLVCAGLVSSKSNCH